MGTEVMVWEGVGGCERVWEGVGGCGRVWEDVGGHVWEEDKSLRPLLWLFPFPPN